MGLTKPDRRVSHPRARRRRCDPGPGGAASQGGSGWRTRSRPTLLTSRLKLPLVTWKFSSGYNFCRVKKKKKPAPRLLLPPTTELGRTPEQPGTYTWGGGRRVCVCGRGIGLYFPDKQFSVEQDRASVPLVKFHQTRQRCL